MQAIQLVFNRQPYLFCNLFQFVVQFNAIILRAKKDDYQIFFENATNPNVSGNQSSKKCSPGLKTQEQLCIVIAIVIQIVLYLSTINNHNMTTTQANSQKSQIYLESPNFLDCRLEAVFAKVRPFRQGGVRIQHQQIKGKHIFHNYGHGNSGVSLAYGSAFMSVKSLTVYVKEEDVHKCAVIGSGLIGLLTANELAKKGFHVTLYSKSPFQPSNSRPSAQMEDGLWLPFGYDSSNRLNYELLSKISYEYYKECMKMNRYQSIRAATIYDRDRDVTELKKIIPPFLYNGYKKVGVQYRNGVSQSYTKFRTFNVNLQMFVEELKVQALLRGVKFVEQNFKTIQQVLKLDEDCIFNCTGYQSKRLFGDEKVKGYVDHTILFTNPHKFDYTLSAKFSDKIQARIHCSGNKIIIRSENLIPAEGINDQYVKDLIQQTNNFFSHRSSMLTAKL